MKLINKKVAAISAIALTASVSSFSTPQPANAQVVELATSAISAIFNRPPRPLPNQIYNFGTGNANGNTFNFCLFPCLPNPTNVSVPTAVRPIVPTQGSFSSSSVQTQTGTIPPRFPVPPQAAPQPTPPRPLLVVPPIRLPINLPL